MGTRKTKTKFRNCAALGLIILASLGLGYYSVKPMNNQYSRIQANINNKKIIEDAEVYAKMYIRDKYGITPDTVKCSKQVNNVLFGKDLDLDYNSPLDLSAVYSGKEFTISAYDYKDESIPVFCDNYQEEEIRSTLNDYVKDIEPDCMIIDSTLYSGNVTFSECNSFMFGADELLTADDSEQFLDNCTGYVEMVSTENKLTNSKISEAMSDRGIDFKLTNFDNSQSLHDFLLKCEEKNINPYSDYAPHITGRTSQISSEMINFTKSVFDSGEFKYAFFANDEMCSDISSFINSVPSESVIERSFSDTENSGYLQHPLTNVYLKNETVVNDTITTIEIYFPLKNANAYLNVDNIALLCCKDNSDERPYVLKPEKCGDYAVFNLPVGEFVFQICSLY